MNELEFETLRAFLKARSGLSLTPEKRYLVESRLSGVCNRFMIDGLSRLALEIKNGRTPALEKAVVEAMTTNETFFFRDKVPFDIFKDNLLPRYIKDRSSSRRLRIWCAASSTGQEPYSIAMLLNEASARISGWQVEIVASDISADVLQKAKDGVYTQFEVQRGLPPEFLSRYFTQVGDNWQISQQIRSMVDFREVNLIHDFSSLGQFDIVYCRNVLIYFDLPTKVDVLARLAKALAPDGSLVLGASETVIGVSDAFVLDPGYRGLYNRTLPLPSMATR